MDVIAVMLLSTFLILEASSDPAPGHKHRVHHRIHVPHKVKTVYRTKIIKVPEHHHHFHEKEKIIQIETKKEEDPIYPPYSEHHFDDCDHHFSESKKVVTKQKTAPRKTEKDVDDELEDVDDEVINEKLYKISKNHRNVGNNRVKNVVRSYGRASGRSKRGRNVVRYH